MIYVNFVYKNSVIHTEKLYIPYAQKNIVRVNSRINSGIIKKPENYDKVLITEFGLSDKEKLFLK